MTAPFDKNVPTQNKIALMKSRNFFCIQWSSNVAFSSYWRRVVLRRTKPNKWRKHAYLNARRSFARNIRVIYTSSRQLTSTLKNGGPRNWP